jgi:hypothetical protein
MKLDPCINDGGSCEEAFRLYEHNLGGTIIWNPLPSDLRCSGTILARPG